MSAAVQTVLVLLVAALLGSIPFGVLVARLWSGADVRKVGSGNIGATNVLRASGPAAGVLTLALDIAKGAAAVWLAMLARPASGPQGAGVLQAGTLADWAALAAVLGHMYSPWVGFRGGKGVATALGALAALSPPLAAAAVAIFSIVLALTHLVSLSSIVACAALPVLCMLHLVRSSPYLPVNIAIAVLIIARHHANIGRLLKGTEHRLGSTRAGQEKPG